MATKKQELGSWGEEFVTKKCACPKCKRTASFKRLPGNFKCVDIICDFCGFLAQVKSMNVKTVEVLPGKILGAAWGPQKERMAFAIYFPLYIVLKSSDSQAIYYLPTDFQNPNLFVPRKALSENAKRAGWQGFYYDLTMLPQGGIIRLL